jgi:hypothetical protein
MEHKLLVFLLFLGWLQASAVEPEDSDDDYDHVTLHKFEMEYEDDPYHGNHTAPPTHIITSVPVHSGGFSVYIKGTPKGKNKISAEIVMTLQKIIKHIDLQCVAIFFQSCVPYLFLFPNFPLFPQFFYIKNNFHGLTCSAIVVPSRKSSFRKSKKRVISNIVLDIIRSKISVL